MSKQSWILISGAIFLLYLLGSCSPNPQSAGLTLILSLAPAPTLPLVQAIQSGGQPAGTPAPGSTGGKQDGTSGAAVYEQHCTVCHGINPQGVSGPALRNSAFINNGNDPAILDIVANGRTGTAMPAWLMAQGGPLTNIEIANVVAFVKTLQNVPVIPPSTPAPEEATETLASTESPTKEPAHPSKAGSPGLAVQLSGDPDNGKPLFGQYCAACHGPQGALGFPNPV